jgi:hypothetical protein
MGGDTNAFLRRNSVENMVEYLVNDLGITQDDVFLDGGSAYNNVVCYVAQTLNCKAFGIEYVNQRILLGSSLFLKCLKGPLVNTKIGFANQDLAHVKSFEPATVAYFFDEVFTPQLYLKNIETAAATRTLKYLITFKESKRRILRKQVQLKGFTFVHSMKAEKLGSGESNTIYFYRRDKDNTEECKEYTHWSETFRPVWEGNSEEVENFYKRLEVETSDAMERELKTRKDRKKISPKPFCP